MKLIILYGLLAKKFGKEIKISFSKKNEIINVLDSIKLGFKRELNLLIKDGFNYCIVENNKEFHLVPCIAGGGPLLIFGAFLIGAAVATAMGLGTLATILISVGLQILMAQNRKNPDFPQLYGATGGGVANVDAVGSSSIFKNQVNVANQGVTIPIGYGRMKVNSYIINISKKNYPTNILVSEEFNLLTNLNFLNIYD
jgi:predicted phage tail protein